MIVGLFIGFAGAVVLIFVYAAGVQEGWQRGFRQSQPPLGTPEHESWTAAAQNDRDGWFRSNTGRDCSIKRLRAANPNSRAKASV